MFINLDRVCLHLYPTYYLILVITMGWLYIINIHEMTQNTMDYLSLKWYGFGYA